MIREIELKNFRNYSEERVSFSSGINLFCGKNGQGKTNLLEAVYFLGMLSSFRRTESSRMVRQGEDSFSISGIFKGNGTNNLSLERGYGGWKRISADGSLYRKKLDYLGKVRMVVFSPDEMELIQGSPDGRRRYLDRTCFNICHSHLRQLKIYRRILKQRNMLLKRGVFQGEELDAWSERLATAGAKVIMSRIDLIGRLNEKLAESHPFLGSDEISVRYAGSCGGSSPEEKKIANNILDCLLTARRDERLRKMTLAGPHRDDAEILINGVVAKSFSSRGEMRSVLLALKTAEAEIYRTVWGESPLTLFDDIASELDIGRREALINFLRQKGHQVLMTTTEAENIPLFGSEGDTLFKVSDGKILH